MRVFRTLVGLAFCGLASALPQGCGGSDGFTSITLHTLAAPGSDEFRLLESVLAEFNARNPGIRVRLVGERPEVRAVMRSIVARRAADVMDVRPEEAWFLSARGGIREFPADFISFGSVCSPRAWQLSFVETKLLSIPWAAAPELLLWNRAAFRAVGLPEDAPPRSWADWVETARWVTRDADGDGRPGVYGFALAARRHVDFARHFAMLVAQFGGGLIEFSERRWVFSTDLAAGRRTLALLAALQEYAPPECIVSDNRATLEQFRSGRAAMVLAGPAGLAPAPGGPAESDIGVAYPPVPPGGRIQCEVGLRHLVIPSFVEGARYRAALELVRFLSGREAQERIARGIGGVTPVVSIRTDVLESATYARSPKLRMFAEALRHATSVLQSMVWEGRCLADWLGEIHSYFISEGGRRSPDEVVEAAYTRGNQAISCLYSDVGHPSATITLGMTLVALLVFAAVAYVVSRH